MESKELTKRAREATEQNMILKSQLQLKEEAVIQLRQQLLRTVCLLNTHTQLVLLGLQCC